MSEYFPELKHLGGRVKVELDCLIMQQKQTLKCKRSRYVIFGLNKLI